MTTAIDTKAAAAVTRAMVRVGATATFIQYPASSYNHATLEVEEGTPTETPVKIIPPYRNSKGFTLSGSLKPSTFFAPEALLTGVAGNALAAAPKVGDEIEYGSQQFTIVEIEPVRSGDSVALYLFRIDETRSVGSS